MTVEESAVTALNTSGRAVLFAGGTVVHRPARAARARHELPQRHGHRRRRSPCVFTVLAAITLLPALLGLLGTRVLSRRERRRLAAEGPADAGRPGVWARWAGVRRSAGLARCPRSRSWSSLCCALPVLLPAPRLLRRRATTRRPRTTRQAYDLLAEGFGPGFNGPLQLVAQTHGAGRPAGARPAGRRGRPTPRAWPGRGPAARPPGATVARGPGHPDHLARSPQETTDLIGRLRDDVVPAAERGTTLKVYVGGVDGDLRRLRRRADRQAAAVPRRDHRPRASCCCMLAFRSLLVPADRRGDEPARRRRLLRRGRRVLPVGLGLRAARPGRAGPVEAFLPVIMLAILFGLSMDYQVFLVSRMHEEWVHTRRQRAGRSASARPRPAGSSPPPPPS